MDPPEGGRETDWHQAEDKKVFKKKASHFLLTFKVGCMKAVWKPDNRGIYSAFFYTGSKIS